MSKPPEPPVGATPSPSRSPGKAVPLPITINGEAFFHDGDPAMTWMLSNVVAKPDAKDNVYPRKERPENKIDGPVALIMAMGRMLTKDNAPSPYERLRPNGFLFV